MFGRPVAPVGTSADVVGIDAVVGVGRFGDRRERRAGWCRSRSGARRFVGGSVSYGPVTSGDEYGRRVGRRGFCRPAKFGPGVPSALTMPF